MSTNDALEAEIVAIDIKAKLESLKPKLQSLNSSLCSSHNDSRASSSCSQNVEIEPHVHYLVEKTELQVSPMKEKFLPFRTTKSNVHDPAKEKLRKKGKHWEITAATPPLIQHQATKMLSLMDSVEIQAEYLIKLKVSFQLIGIKMWTFVKWESYSFQELQEKQAAERLAAKMKRMEKIKVKIQLPVEDVLKSNPSFTNYRSKPTVPKSNTNLIEGEQKFNEDDEVHDPLDEEKSGGVSYTVYE